MYGVVAVSWVRANMPPMMATSPNGTIRPTGSLSVSAPAMGIVHIAPRPCTRHQPAGLQRGLAAHLLEVGRHEQQAAEERRGEQEHRDDRDREVAVAGTAAGRAAGAWA